MTSPTASNSPSVNLSPDHDKNNTTTKITTTSPKIYSSLLHPWSPSESLYRTSNLVKTKGTIPLLPPPTPTLISTFNLPPRPKTRMSAGAVALCKHFERGIGKRYGNAVISKSGNKANANPNIAGKSSSSLPSTPSLNDINLPESNEKQAARKPSSEHQIPHPFWPFPTGSNEHKTQIAAGVLDDMLRHAVWRNVMLLHVGVAVYEIRNERGYGMRWTLEVEEKERDRNERPMELNGEGRINSDESNSGYTRGDADGSENRGGNCDRDDDEMEEGKGDVHFDNADQNEKVWCIKKVSFRGFLEPIEGLEHELPASNEASVSESNM